eukprot:scaffold183730_cov31-Tisochrysis_lutea.AAC.2
MSSVWGRGGQAHQDKSTPAVGEVDKPICLGLVKLPCAKSERLARWHLWHPSLERVHPCLGIREELASVGHVRLEPAGVAGGQRVDAGRERPA